MNMKQHNNRERKAKSTCIHIRAGINKGQSSVEVSGSTRHAITVDERQTYNLDQKSLRKAVQRYFGGPEPDAVFLNDSDSNNCANSTASRDDESNCTPHKANECRQVHIVLRPVSSHIASVSSSPTTIATFEFENTTPEEGAFAQELSRVETVTVTSAWSARKNKNTPVEGGTLPCVVDCLGVSDTGETTVRFDRNTGFLQAIRSKHVEKQSVTVGSKRPTAVQLKPQHSATANLVANKAKMKVVVAYEARLAGKMVAQYKQGFRGQEYWPLDIGAALGKKGSSSNNAMIVKETMELEYYCNARVFLDDSREALLPVSSLAATGTTLLNNEANARKRVRSLQTLQHVARARLPLGAESPQIPHTWGSSGTNSQATGFSGTSSQNKPTHDDSLKSSQQRDDASSSQKTEQDDDSSQKSGEQPQDDGSRNDDDSVKSQACDSTESQDDASIESKEDDGSIESKDDGSTKSQDDSVESKDDGLLVSQEDDDDDDDGNDDGSIDDEQTKTQADDDISSQKSENDDIQTEVDFTE